MAQVIFENVEKVYDGNVRAVKGIDLHIQDEEFCVLVGPSGCGKSTSLRMVAGLEEITSGTIKIGDRVVNDVPPKDRQIAMVFQNYALYPHMTVYQNMAFGLKLRRMPKKEIDQRVREASKILGLDELLERKPKALSGGQRQRVAVGRAIVRDPACFLFDEPLSNLDAKLRVQTRAEIKQLHRRLQTTTIYVTHDQEEAMTLGDRVVVMSEGLIQQADTPLETYHRPANRFVAGFLGTPPMNFLEGRLEQRDGTVCFIGGEACQGVNIALTQPQAESVAGKVGQEIVFGVRPEGMYLRQTEHANQESQSIPVTIDVSEPLGSTMDLYVHVGDTPTGEQVVGEAGRGVRIVARVAAEPIQEATQARLYLDMRKTHIFEPGKFGQNLTIEHAVIAG